MPFTPISSTDPADLAALLNRLGNELSADIGSAGDTATWAGVTGKPTTYPPAPHTHAWAAIEDKPATFPPSAHSHAVADVTGLGERLGHLEMSTGWRDITGMVPDHVSGRLLLLRTTFTMVVVVDELSVSTDGILYIDRFPVGYRPLYTTRSHCFEPVGDTITGSMSISDGGYCNISGVVAGRTMTSRVVGDFRKEDAISAPYPGIPA